MNQPVIPAFVFCALGALALAAAQALAPAIAQQPKTELPVKVQSVAADDQRLFAEAVRHYKAGRWSAAYGRFVALADRGHSRSARIALAMFNDGPLLYGSQWDAAPSQLAAWQQSARGDRGAEMVALKK